MKNLNNYLICKICQKKKTSEWFRSKGICSQECLIKYEQKLLEKNEKIKLGMANAKKETNHDSFKPWHKVFVFILILLLFSSFTFSFIFFIKSRNNDKETQEHKVVTIKEKVINPLNKTLQDELDLKNDTLDNLTKEFNKERERLDISTKNNTDKQNQIINLKRQEQLDKKEIQDLKTDIEIKDDELLGKDDEIAAAKERKRKYNLLVAEKEKIARKNFVELKQLKINQLINLTKTINQLKKDVAWQKANGWRITKHYQGLIVEKENKIEELKSEIINQNVNAQDEMTILDNKIIKLEYDVWNLQTQLNKKTQEFANALKTKEQITTDHLQKLKITHQFNLIKKYLEGVEATVRLWEDTNKDSEKEKDYKTLRNDINKIKNKIKKYQNENDDTPKSTVKATIERLEQELIRKMKIERDARVVHLNGV